MIKCKKKILNGIIKLRLMEAASLQDSYLRLRYQVMR